MTIKERMLCEIAVIFLVGICGWISGYHEITNLRYYDIGQWFMAFGVIWGSFAFFQITEVQNSVVTLILAFGVFLFGYVMYDYGFFYSLLVIGIYIVLISHIIGLLFDAKITTVATIGICLLVIGLLFKSCAGPTKTDKYDAEIYESNKANESELVRTVN